MFRIRESYLDQETVCIWVDGQLSDRDLESFRNIIQKYLDLKMRVLINLAHLTQMGWEGKRFLQEIRDLIILVDLPEYLKSEIINKEPRPFLFTIIGERINATRPSIMTAVEKRDSKTIRQEAIRQTEAGADYLDVNAGSRPGQIIQDMVWLIKVVQDAVATPICLDSPDPAVLQEACQHVKQKLIINSISLENNCFQTMLSFLRGKDCSIIAACLDDQGLPKTAKEIIDRAGILIKGLEAIGFDQARIHIDPLIQPEAINIDAGLNAVWAIQGIRDKYPDVHITCGLSNISFGLPHRRAVNRTLLPILMTAGLDGAILDPLDEKIMSTLIISKMILGQDRFCRQYTQAARTGRIVL